MNAEIITVGTELLLGDILNSNSQFLSRELAAYGIQLLYQSTVGDNTSRLEQVLSVAMGRSDLVIITGGLGPTPDDLTRETVSEALSLPLELHEESLQRIEEYFTNTGREMTDNNKKQAMLPKGCTVFPNDHGTAPGCAVERYGQSIILLPGPPRELIPMFNDYVAPYLSRFSGGTIFSRTVGVFGISESAVAQRLADLLSGANPTVAPYAKDGEVVLRITAKAADIDAAKALCDPAIEEIRKRLGVNVYGVDMGSLQKAVVSLLKEKNMKIATAESCTAGLLSGRITEVPGASSVFECGIAAYSKEIKRDILGVDENVLEQYGAVSAEVACAMAVGARRVGKAHLGIGITGEAGPESGDGQPVGTVFIALADEKRVWVKKIATGSATVDRDYIRYIATSNALDLTRRYLEAMPAIMAGGETLAVPEAAPKPEIPATAPVVHKKSFWASIFPWKGDSKAEIFRKSGVLVAIAMLLTAGVLAAFNFILEPSANVRIFKTLQNMYKEGATSLPEGAPEGMLTQFATLYTRNSDIRGWVRIEDTNINYPIMQSQAGADYVDYSRANFDKQYPAFGVPYGVPYFDSKAAFFSSQSVNRSLVVYGNNVGDQMFGPLTQYTSLDFLKAHPVIEMNTIFDNAQWKIFAVLYAGDPEVNQFDFTQADFAEESAFFGFVYELQRRSLYTFPEELVTFQDNDSLLLLTTTAEKQAGFSGARLIIAAREVRLNEPLEMDMSGIIPNDDSLMPKEWEEAHATESTNTTHSVTVRPPTPSQAESTSPITPDTSASSDPSTESTGPDTTTDNSSETTQPESSQTTPPPASSTTEESSATSTESSTTTSSSATSTTASTTEPPTTSTTESTTESTTSTTTPQPTEPPVNPPTPPDGVLAGSVPESEFMQYFRLRDTRTGKLYEPTTKEELQEAVSRIVKYELGSARTYGATLEAQKAQAIAAYTFTLNWCKNGRTYDLNLPSFDLNNKYDKQIYDAVGEVIGIKIVNTSISTVKNMACETMYCHSSCGVTASSQYVFTATLPYLKSVTSPYDTEEYIMKYSGGGDHLYSTVTVKLSDLFAQISADLGGELVMMENHPTPEGAPFALIYEGTEGASYVKYINYSVKGNQVKGKAIRDAVNKLGLHMRSHAFTISSYDPATDMLVLDVKGYGHGVGMSQYGAVGYANEAGWNYQQILKHYYSITSNSDHQLVAPVW